MSDARGDTPLHRAARKGDAPAVKALIKCRKNLEQDTERGVQGLRTEMLRTKNKKGDTALHEAVRFCHLDVAEILSEEDNDILCYGNEAGQTPLHLAIKRRHRPFVLQMLDKYRELQIPDCGDRNGRTLLHEAVISKDEVNDIRSKDGGFPIVVILMFPRLKRFNGEILFKLQGHENNDVGRFNQEELLALLIWRKTFEEAIDVTTSFTPETDKAIELTLVAATLIATVTFAAGFTLPGGYVSDKGPQQGSAVLKKNPAFKTFVIADAIAMVLSTSAVFIHVISVLKQDKKFSLFLLVFNLILNAIIAMLIAFMGGIYAVLGASDGLAIAVCVIVIGCSFYFFPQLIPDLSVKGRT
nr:ankyrin repeat-containing protein At5g02620-like [Ziziphus jujuba var. spinosa]